MWVVHTVGPEPDVGCMHCRTKKPEPAGDSILIGFAVQEARAELELGVADREQLRTELSWMSQLLEAAEQLQVDQGDKIAALWADVDRVRSTCSHAGQRFCFQNK